MHSKNVRVHAVYSDALIVYRERQQHISHLLGITFLAMETITLHTLPCVAFFTTTRQIGFHYTHPILADSKCVIMRLLYSRSLPQAAASFIIQH